MGSRGTKETNDEIRGNFATIIQGIVCLSIG